MRFNRLASLISLVLMFGGPMAGLCAGQGTSRLSDAIRSRDAASVSALLKEGADVNASAKDGATPLHWAVHIDDLNMVTRLVRAGAKTNVTNVYGVSPLALACLNGSAAIVDVLLQAGADPNAANPVGETPLMTAARTGNAAVVKSLLARGATIETAESTKGQTALMWAAAEGHSNVVRELLQAGADVRRTSKAGFAPLHFAAYAGDVDTARALLTAGAPIDQRTPQGQTPLLLAAAGGHMHHGTLATHEALVEFLLDKGADPNVADNIGFTPLHGAVWGQTGSVRMVKRLLAAGANPEAKLLEAPPQLPLYRLSTVGLPALKGGTPFALAAANADAPIMRVLAEGGANPTQFTGNQSTPLMLAAGIGWLVGNSPVTLDRALDAVKVAAELGGDVNAVNTSGQTALHGAAHNGADTIVQFLADKGANLNVRDKGGRAPIDMARRAQLAASLIEHRTTVNLLKKLGAEDSAPNRTTP